jgi:outer membrane autotransporter protein
MRIDTRLPRTCGSTSLILAVACVLGVAPCAHAQSQPPPVTPTLDEQVLFYLGNNCANLDPTGADGFGPNLETLCGYPSGVPAAAGGGAASPQGSTLSLQNSVIQERLERAKEKGGHAGTASTAAASRGRSGRGRAENAESASESGSSSVASRFNIFASGSYETLDRSITPFEDGYDSSVIGGAFGFDYQFNDKVVAGLVAGYRQQDADFKGGGDFKMTAFEPSIYVSVLPSPKTFLQFVAGYGGQSSDVNRAVHFEVIGSGASVDGTAASVGDANAYNASAQFGFDQPAGRFTYGPRVGVNYGQTKIDPYSETGGTGLELTIDGRTVKSFQAVVAFYGSWAISTKNAIVLPQFNVGYVHEFEDDASIVTAQFAEDVRPIPTRFTYGTSVPDSDFFNIEAGVSTVFARGIQFFVNLRTMVGNDNFDNTGGTIGIRFEL